MSDRIVQTLFKYLLKRNVNLLFCIWQIFANIGKIKNWLLHKALINLYYHVLILKIASRFSLIVFTSGINMRQQWDPHHDLCPSHNWTPHQDHIPLYPERKSRPYRKWWHWNWNTRQLRQAQHVKLADHIFLVVRTAFTLLSVWSEWRPALLWRRFLYLDLHSHVHFLRGYKLSFKLINPDV